MSATTKTSLDKTKLLNQMLEVLTGDEYEGYDADKTSAGTSVKHHEIAEDLDKLETFH